MSFDVFLSHNNNDKPAIKTLGMALKKRGMTVWLDEWELRPGLRWQKALEEIVGACRSAMVCFGQSGIGPWEEEEMEALLRRFVNEKKAGNIVPIIPVLLPGAPKDVKLPGFLDKFTWVDLRSGLTPDSLERLRWGVTGERPRADAPTVCLAKVTPDLRQSRETVAKYLNSAGLNVLPVKPYPSDAGRLLSALEEDLGQADVFVQVLGAVHADRTEELPQGEEVAQFELAQQLGKTILQWRDKSIDVDAIDDEPHRALVGGEYVVCNDLAEFNKLVSERAQRVYEVGRPSRAAGKQWLALIKADKPDHVVADEVCESLTAAQVNCRVTRTGKSMMDWLREVPYDVVLIVYGFCSDEWLQERGDELMVVDLNLKDMAPVRAYYVCAEEAQLPYHGNGVLKVRHRDQAGWEKLMAAIQQRGCRP